MFKRWPQKENGDPNVGEGTRRPPKMRIAHRAPGAPFIRRTRTKHWAHQAPRTHQALGARRGRAVNNAPYASAARSVPDNVGRSPLPPSSPLSARGPLALLGRPGFPAPLLRRV
jgi:hypothetical protein